MNYILSILVFLLCQPLIGDDKVVEANEVMGKGKLVFFMVKEYNLRMEACYDDGTHRVVLFTKDKETWLHFDEQLQISSMFFLVNGKQVKMPLKVRTIKFKESNRTKNFLSSINIAYIFESGEGVDIELKLDLFLNDKKSHISLKRAPFGYWEMSLINKE